MLSGITYYSVREVIENKLALWFCRCVNIITDNLLQYTYFELLVEYLKDKKSKSDVIKRSDVFL